MGEVELARCRRPGRDLDAHARPVAPAAHLARAIAIIRLDADDAPPEARPILRAFERGLRAGYERVAGPLVDMPLFHIWAGRAMLHDLAPRLAANPAQAARIRDEINAVRETGREENL